MPGLFKPASEDVIDNRREQRMAGTNVDFRVPLNPNRRDSFWYSGDVAVIAYGDLEEFRKFTLTVMGKIEIVFLDEPGRSYLDGDAVEKALSRGYTDADIDKKYGSKVKWEHNNWFALGCESSKWEGRVYIPVGECGETFTEYDKGIEFSKDIITDDQKWSYYTRSLV